MNLILLHQHEFSDESSSIALPPDDDRSKHIIGRLDKKPGDTVSIGVIGGCKGKATVEYLDVEEAESKNNKKSRNKHGLRLTLIKESLIPPTDNEPEITLILAVPFPARLKALWPTITSFAYVTRIIIIQGQLSDPDFSKTSALQPTFYEDSIVKGMSQGGRTRPVKVDVCLEGSDVLSRDLFTRLGLVDSEEKNGESHGVSKIFLDCGDETTVPPPARDIVLKHCQNIDSTKSMRITPKAIVAVGPERGWTDDEASIFVKECGFESATLGASILRVDTAVIAGLGVVSAALDECQSEVGNTICKRQRQT